MNTITDQELDQLKYPTGRFARGAKADTPERLAACIAKFEALPGQLRAAAEGLTDAQLDTPYRPGGWTVRQLVHHVADSHMNALIRVKWTLSEETPTIKTYKQDLWAEQADARTLPIAPSLNIVEGIHARLVTLVKNIPLDDLQRLGFIHPEQQREMKLAELMELYAWHGGHHVAHITRLKERMGW